MEVRPSSLAPRFDPLVQPFHLLGIDPAATNAEVEAAYVRALRQGGISEWDLAHALGTILDPARRLVSELAYPIDSPPAQIETLYADLAGNVSGHHLLPNATRLAPLSRANFVAALAARRPADANLLVALVDAHASINVTEIYAILKVLRRRAGCPTPSLVHVSQGLSDLRAMHIDVAIGGYDPIQSATEPMLECARSVLATPERYRVDVLSDVLNAYRRSTADLRGNACRRLEAACLALTRLPEAPSIDELNCALRLWNSLYCPLVLLDAYEGCPDQDVAIAVDQVRGLLADLGFHHHHATARKVVNLARDVFSLVPGAMEHFNETASLLDSLWLEAEAEPLRKLIEQIESDPSSWFESVGRDGLRESSRQQVRILWQAFRQLVQTTKWSEFADRPWWMIRDLALRLGNDPETAALSSTLLAGLIRYGESALPNPAMPDMFRDDLRDVERRHPVSLAKGRRSKQLRKRILWACLALAGVLCSVIMYYRYFDAGSWRFLASTPVPPAVPAAGSAQVGSDPSGWHGPTFLAGVCALLSFSGGATEGDQAGSERPSGHSGIQHSGQRL